MLYVYINPVTAHSFNQALYTLMRPKHLRDENYTTNEYCTVLEHPSNGWAALVLPETETVPIHLEATTGELEQVLSIFLNDGALTQEEINGIIDAVDQAKGQQIRIADFIPVSWQTYVFTKEEMTLQGWFPEEINEEENES